jgi:hypothetical protein
MKGLNLLTFNDRGYSHTIAKLYDTVVADIWPNFKGKITIVRLSHGGFVTMSTVKAINKALTEARLDASVYRKQGVMYLNFKGETKQVSRELGIVAEKRND